MHANQRLILIQKWCDTRDFQLTLPSTTASLATLSKMPSILTNQTMASNLAMITTTATSTFNCSCHSTPTPSNPYLLPQEKLCKNPLFMTSMIAITLLFLTACIGFSWQLSRTRLLNKLRALPRERRGSFLLKICKDVHVNPAVDPRDIAALYGGRG